MDNQTQVMIVAAANAVIYCLGRWIIDRGRKSHGELVTPDEGSDARRAKGRRIS